LGTQRKQFDATTENSRDDKYYEIHVSKIAAHMAKGLLMDLCMYKLHVVTKGFDLQTNGSAGNMRIEDDYVAV
jgi:hypothetical protein